nr:unnamed protein product [Callosobruchus chinensis]
MENWVPVTDQNGHCVLEDENIVVQNIITGEIGHVPATAENYNAFNIVPLTKDVNSDETEAKDHNTETSRIEWGEETKLLLDLYHQYLPQIGPMKKFKNKKKVWERISMEIEKNLGILRTPVQCESRFKTIMKRKSLVISENKKSGNARMSLQFIYGIRRYDRISHKLKDASWLNMQQRREIQAINLIHKVTLKRFGNVIVNAKKKCYTLPTAMFYVNESSSDFKG